MLKPSPVLMLSMALCLPRLFAAPDAPASSGSLRAEELVREAASALPKMHSYELDVISNQSINDGKYIKTSHTYVETSFEQSGGHKRIRMVSRKAADTTTIVSDGSGYWIYHESDRHYQRRTGSLPAEVYRSPTPGFSGTLSAENLPVSMQSARIVRQEPLPVEDRKELCDVVVVQLKPDAAPPDYQVKSNELTLWLSHTYRVPMKVSGTFIHKNPDGSSQAMDMTIIVQRFHPNAHLPLSTWTFVPPPESQPEPGTPVLPLK
jgi:outer membrane lipoprotein-sorting protein